MLDAADPGYRAEFDRQLAGGGRARLWVPDDGDARRRAEPITDLRGARDLPVLIVAGGDADQTAAALDALVADLEDGVIAVDQPAELDGPTGTTEDYTVAIINRGMPSFNVEADGNLYLSIMRSCSGWPSGVWIDPPRRSTPDGANFQFQHWSHTLRLRDRGRRRRLARRRDRPRRTRVQQPARRPGVRRPPGPPAGDGGLRRGRAGVGRPDRPQARRRRPRRGWPGWRLDPARRHRAAPVRIVGPPDPGDDPESMADRDRRPGRTCSRRDAQPLDGVRDRRSTVRLDPYEIATVRRDARGDGRTGRRGGRAGPARRGGPARLLRLLAAQQGCGPDGLPIGHGPDQAVVPHRRGAVRRARSSSPRSGPTAPVAGSVAAHRPARLGWRRRPSGSIGSRRARTWRFEASSGRRPGRPPGRYFVAARITDDAGQTHEDVVTIDYRAGRRWHRPRSPADGRAFGSRLGWAVERALTTAGIGPEPGTAAHAGAPHDRGGEIARRVARPRRSRSAPGGGATLRVSLSNTAASEIRGEAQVLSPLETWSTITPWTQGFTVEPGGRTDHRIRCRAASGRRRRHVLGAGQGHVLRAGPLLGIGRGDHRSALASALCPRRAGPSCPEQRRELTFRRRRSAQHEDRRSQMTRDIKVGVLPWGQRTDWASLQDIGRRADELGYDSLWTWDHLYPIQGDWRGPIFEGYLTLAGWAAVTSRATLGLMVGANTFRNPALTAKMATTLDHISDGRAVLGIGGAWFEREHEAFGIEFGSGFGERLDRLDEAVQLMRGMLEARSRPRAARAITPRASATTRRRSRRACRSSSAATASRRRSPPSRGTPTPGTPAATSSSSATRTRSSGGGATRSAGTKPRSSGRSASGW